MIFKKKFVSIYISASKLQIVELSGNKKKVQSYFSLDLPVGLISNYKVTNVKALSEALSAIWKKVGLKEKTVALVVPEFSSLIKTFDLPRVDYEELDEAIMWRTADFLPDDLKNFIVDWKIVGEAPDKYQILSASIEKKVLDGYIQAVTSSGLTPMMVVTPSLCLSNLLDEGQEGRLIVYQNVSETLLVISLGRKIVGSSVINPKSIEELVLTIKKMVKYYSPIVPSTIFVGGTSSKQNLVAELQKALEVKTVQITPNISGLTPEQTQEYLISLSSQVKEVNDPSDQNSINLLPLDLVKEYSLKRLKLNIWTLTLFTTLVLWFSFTSTILIYFYLGSKVFINPNPETTSAVSQDQIKIINQVKETNTLSQKIIKISSSSNSSEKVLNDIFSAKPNGVKITGYLIDFNSGDISLMGISSERVNLIDFKYKLEENKDFSLVAIPISSFEKEKDFEFEMNFAFLPSKSVNTQVKKPK